MLKTKTFITFRKSLPDKFHGVYFDPGIRNTNGNLYLIRMEGNSLGFKC